MQDLILHPKRLLPLFLLCSTTILAQKNDVFKDPNDLVRETQRVVSVRPGQVIDTAYFRTLFLPTAHFTVVGMENGAYSCETMGLNEFLLTLPDEYYTKGYSEKALGEEVEIYGGIAQVMQAFEAEDSDNIRARGVGSYQLVQRDGRWWIANMVWTMSENGGRDIPKKYTRE